VTERPRVFSVRLESGASRDDLAGVESTLAHHGIAVAVERSGEGLSQDRHSWLIEITLLSSVEEFFLTFGATFGTTPAADGEDLVRQWIRDLVDARAGSLSGRGVITIADQEGTTVVLHVPLSEQALAVLPTIDWAEMAGHRLDWDTLHDEWLPLGEQ